MISEFTDLSDKIDRLAELTQSLRRENATLRHSNTILAAENEAFMTRLSDAQLRVEALLATLPPEPVVTPEPFDMARASSMSEPAGVHECSDMPLPSHSPDTSDVVAPANTPAPVTVSTELPHGTALYHNEATQ